MSSFLLTDWQHLTFFSFFFFVKLYIKLSVSFEIRPCGVKNEDLKSLDFICVILSFETNYSYLILKSSLIIIIYLDYDPEASS